jgi:hypothetical protein
VLLAVDARHKFDYEAAKINGGRERDITKFDGTDYALLALFMVYTLEIFVRIIVSGFIINPREYSTINRQIGLREAVTSKANQLFGGLHRQPSQKRTGTNFDPAQDPQQPSIIRTFTIAQMNAEPGPGDSRGQARVRLAHRAYLRHSFNRTDFVAVVSYWIAFVLGLVEINNSPVILVFRMLSCLRIIRLLNLTSGTSVSLYEATIALNADISQGYSPEYEEGRAIAAQCCVSYWFLLAPLRYRRCTKLQIELQEKLCVDRPSGH